MTTLIRNIKALVQAGENIPNLIPGSKMHELPIIENAFLILKDGVIEDYGKMEELKLPTFPIEEEIDATGRFVLPTYVDSHTHAIFAQPREDEFVNKINGLTYQQVAERGGGILNSANKLQHKPEDNLFEDAKIRIEEMIRMGTGALEIKSGYGLSVDAEIKMLRVIQRLKKQFDIPIKATFLGAHAFPVEYKDNHQGYVDLIIHEMLPIIEKENLADYIDVFCEQNYFSVEEMEKILKAGIKIGLKPKVHVNQFTILGGVEAAIKLGAISVDHLEEIDDYDVKILQESNCIPTLLPGCSFFTNLPYGDAKKMMKVNLPVALATDFNPGSTPNSNMSFIWSLACIKMHMTPEEAFNAMTINAAAALEMADEIGSISKGKRGNVMITKKIPSLAFIPYSFGHQLIERVIIGK